MGHDVFISYSTKDKTIANAVCAKIEENNIRAWIAPRDVSVGTNFAKSIIQAIDNCKVFILLWSAEAQISEHILSELNQAFDKGIPIIPFRLEEIEPTDEMRYYFGRTHWLDAIDPPLEKHIETLIATINSNIGKKELASEEPEEKISLEIKSSEPKKKEKPLKIKKPISKYLPLVVFVLLSLTAVTLYFSEYFSGDSTIEDINTYSTPTTDNDQFDPSSGRPIMATGTVKTSQTAVPIPQWELDAIEFVEPIFAAIENHTPEFQDDFSNFDSNLRYDQVNEYEDLCDDFGEAKKEIFNGILKLNLSPLCRGARLSHPNLNVDNFLLQFDINLSTIPFEILFNPSYYDSLDQINFRIEPNGKYDFAFEKNSILVEAFNGNIHFENYELNTLSIIKQNGHFIVIYDSKILFYYDELGDTGDIGANFIYFYDTLPSLSKVFSIDNMKIWDLDNVELAKEIDNNRKLKILSSSILNILELNSPDYRYDFFDSSNDYDYHSEGYEDVCSNPDDTYISVHDSVIELTIDPQCPNAAIQLSDTNYERSAFQFELGFFDSYSNLDIHFNGDHNTDSVLYLHLNSNNSWELLKYDSGIEVLSYSPWQDVNFEDSFILTVIFKDLNMLIFADTNLLGTFTFENEFVLSGIIDIIFSTFEAEISSLHTMNFYGVSVWDMERFDLSLEN